MDKGFWQERSESADSARFSPSGTWENTFASLSASAPLDRDGRGLPAVLAAVDGRWSNCRVYLDVPATFATDDNVIISLASRSASIWHIVAEAPVSAMALEPFVNATRLRGIGLTGSGMAGSSWRIQARSKVRFRGTATAPTGRVELELWGTESPHVAAQGALGASLAHGGYADRTIETRGAQLMLWNAELGKWLPAACDTSGRLIVAP